MNIRLGISKTLCFLLLVFVSAVVRAGDLTVTYYHNDATGSPVAATNEAGEVIWRKNYTPYGEASGKDGNNRRGYTGHVEDTNGLVYAGARYYNPDLGRFLSVDPVGFNESNPMSFNRYAYANNNPYKYVDPDGRTPLDIEVARQIAVETQTDLKFPDGYAIVDFDNPNDLALTSPGVGTQLSSRYLEKLNDKEAADLLDTIIHEGVHFKLDPHDERQDDTSGKGYPYDEAKRRTTKELTDRFNKERKQKNVDGDKGINKKDQEKNS